MSFLRSPRFDLPLYENRAVTGQIICHACGEPGHKITTCPTLKQLREQQVVSVVLTTVTTLVRMTLRFLKCHFHRKCFEKFNFDTVFVRKFDANSSLAALIFGRTKFAP